MKALAALCCASVLLVFAAPTFANEPPSACQAKRRNIEAQLANATEHGRKQEAAGLKRALRANQANCTDASLEKERGAEIRQAQKKVAEREKSLREAQQKGDPKKLAERQAKLDEARRELTEAERPIER
ncbi:MAG: DUF1090 domain-containing protein [Hydrogenophaga sp.]|uniref:DUF1090 domain-containing protein n=1 Tax=Hydrogenophaga sp. TaxID=1904254 RepID=UPI0025BFD20D|nr:DUF1090 domain-containing protein [Hydrogenophaga sp.]MBU7572541.1 DUF1090 domain-containing protein [Hydrogenophaga sp.]